MGEQQETRHTECETTSPQVGRPCCLVGDRSSGPVGRTPTPEEVSRSVDRVPTFYQSEDNLPGTTLCGLRPRSLE